MLNEKSEIPGWKILFWKCLYRIYSSNKGASRLLRNRITVLGYMVGVGLVLVGALRLGSSENVLFAIIAILASMLLFSFISVFFRRATVSAKRHLPKMATVDTPLEYNIELTNQSILPLRGASLKEIASRSVPSQDVFVYSVEPGEELRNAFDRLFIVYRWQWLTGARQGFRSVESGPVKVQSKKSSQIRMRIIPMRRGMTRLGDLKILLPDPLSLFQRCRHVEQEEDHILVLPKRYKISNLEILGEARNQVGGDAQSKHIGHSSEFVSLRDYRPGDPIKHVDWKSWAKTGEPVVREYEDVYYPRHGLLLDTAVHPTLVEEFEEAVSVASSFASSIDTSEGLLDLVMLQQEAKVITIGKDVARVDKMLEAIACAEIETEPDWEGLSKRILQMAPDLSGCIMVFAEWSEERAKILNKTVMAGCNVVAFIVTRDVEKSKSILKKHGAATEIYFLEYGQIQQGLNLALR